MKMSLPSVTSSVSVLLTILWMTLADDEISSCSRGHVKIPGSCFVFGPTKKTWSEAEQVCGLNSMHMASISTQEKHDALNDYMSKVFYVHEVFWTDLKKQNNEFYHTTYMTAVNKNFWWPGEPNGGNMEKCVAKYMYGWMDLRCEDRFSVICEGKVCPSSCKDDTDGTGQPANSVDVTHCANGALRLGDTCYFIETNKTVTGDDAVTECSQKSASLARMNTDEKYKQVDAYLRTLNRPNWNMYWIAGRRISGTTRFVVGNEAVTGARWTPGEPNNLGGAEECISYQYFPNETRYTWNDNGCDKKFYSICELSDCPTECVAVVQTSTTKDIGEEFMNTTTQDSRESSVDGLTTIETIATSTESTVSTKTTADTNNGHDKGITKPLPSSTLSESAGSSHRAVLAVTISVFALTCSMMI